MNYEKKYKRLRDDMITLLDSIVYDTLTIPVGENRKLILAEYMKKLIKERANDSVSENKKS